MIYRTILLVALSVVSGIGVLYWRHRPTYGYFQPPLDRTLQLAANFGELREGHFHMGLDIRTGGKEGLSVYAAADGYISHLSIREDGLGKALFITHPNGLITVYGHLQRFTDSLEALVRQRQYAMQSWQQDLDLPAGRCPVTKGDLIAYSGNTGSSQAPHLHFEVRDGTSGRNMNPQLEGFGVKDDIPPVISGLYWYDRRYGTYTARARKIAITGHDGHYHAAQGVIRLSSPLVSLGISATDKSSASPHLSNIFGADLRLDDSLIHSFALRGLSPTDTRYINACIDYSKWFRSGIYVQHLSTLPGNHAPIFASGKDGLISLQDTLVHTVRIRVDDVQGNQTELTARIQYAPLPLSASPAKAGVPSQIVFVQPDKETIIKGHSFLARFRSDAFYDWLPFHWQEHAAVNSRQASVLISLHDPTVPVHDRFVVQVRTTLSKDNPLRNRTVMQLISGDSQYTVKGSWQGDWMTGSFNRLGILCLLIDTAGPVIHPYQWEEGQTFGHDVREISIQCRDDLGLPARFRGEIDGVWAPFAQKGDVYTYTFDDTCPRGRHRVVITAEDIAGNRTRKEMNFVRE